MSADRDALLDALRDEPDDEKLRLIYADWLEDNGQHERAEFIRLCYELSGLNADNPHAVLLEQRRKQLFRKHKKYWGPGLPKPVSEVLAHRGLVHRIDSTATQFLKCGNGLCDEPLTRVIIRNAGTKLVQILESPTLNGVRELAILDSRLRDDDVLALAESPRLAGLRTLRLAACDITSDRAAILAGSPYLGNLRTLDLGHYHRRDEEIDNTLWRNVGMTRAISTGNTNHLDDAGFIALLESPHLRELEMLIVCNNWITLDGFHHLWRGDRFRQLRRLDLSYNYLGPQGLRELAGSPLMKRLTSLEIQGNEVGPEGVSALAESRNVRQLKLLDISGATAYDDRPRLENSAAEALANSPHLGGLEHLILSFTEIGDKGAKALAKSPNLKSLLTLVLGNSRIGDGGARAFASSELLRRATLLDLSANSITSAGGNALARSKKAGEQLALELSGNEIDSEACDRLVARFGERVSVSVLETGEME